MEDGNPKSKGKRQKPVLSVVEGAKGKNRRDGRGKREEGKRETRNEKAETNNE
jgi:hypothetical protein